MAAGAVAVAVFIATALARMASAVSISFSTTGSSSGSESSESDKIAPVARFVRGTFFCAMWLSCSCCKKFAHFDGPSISSTNFNLFLVLS